MYPCQSGECGKIAPDCNLPEVNPGYSEGMAKFAAFLFSILALGYLGFLVFGMIQIWPWGAIGLFFLLGLAILFGSVVKGRMDSKEDDYYSKNVDK